MNDSLLPYQLDHGESSRRSLSGTWRFIYEQTDEEITQGYNDEFN
jgi:hypothetical protein